MSLILGNQNRVVSRHLKDQVLQCQARNFFFSEVWKMINMGLLERQSVKKFTVGSILHSVNDVLLYFTQFNSLFSKAMVFIYTNCTENLTLFIY